jgi:long-chain acyl-CoA synthetase
MGIKRGDKVGLLLPNVPHFPIAYYGILKLGAVVVPMNVLLKSDEIEYVLKDSDATALISWEGFVGEAAAAFSRVDACKYLVVAQPTGSSNPLPAGSNVFSFASIQQDSAPTFALTPTKPDDTAVILYTSGTTGKPKGAELTNFNMFFNAKFAGDSLMPSFPGDVVVCVLPLFHSFGQSSVLNAFIGRGCAISLVARFDPVKVLEVIQRDKVTHFEGVPTMFFGLLNCPERKNYDTSSIKVSVSGGSAMPVEVLEAFEREFGVAVLEGYGLSETSPTASFNLIDRPRKAGSIGLPIWGVEMKVVDDNDQEVAQGQPGEIVIRGHNVMKGYYKRPEATAEAMRNDWFHSGDIAYVDAEGYFFIVDRKKDMIVRGGFNVYPREIEEVLYQHPAVREAAVIGVPDPKMGEEVKAYVALKPDKQATPEELIQFVKEKIAAYKYPREVEILEDLPKGPTGKLLKRELRDLNGKNSAKTLVEA